MRYGILDREAVKAVKLAQRISKELLHPQTDLEHLLVACLVRRGVLSPLVQKDAYAILNTKCKSYCMGGYKISDRMEDFFSLLSQELYVKAGIGKVSLTMLVDRLLQDDGLSKFSKQLEGLQNNQPHTPQAAAPPKAVFGKSLEKYARNLTQMAAKGQIEPCFGRQGEIERVMRVLNRKTKNNPCLIGEPGVGKTAVIEGLALMLVQGKVPIQLQGKQLYCLDIASVVAGTKYRGDFEDRVRNILEEAANGKGIILFIDEVHTIIGAGAAEGAIDAANILKPALARGQIQLIGATTLQEYRRCIEKDAALERRFQQIMVEEPDRMACINILRGLKGRFESFHRLVILDEAIIAAVDYSVRYLPEKFLPDKAIDLLDDTAAGKMLSPQEQIQVTSQDIAQTISRWTGVPLNQLTHDEKYRLANLRKELEKDVVGQAEAVRLISNAVIRSRLGFSGANRPLASFLFCGMSGVGKTYLAKQLAIKLFGGEKTLFRYDMTEYSEGASISKLIGAPPGYVGHGEPGQLTEAVRRHPFCIVLFDELEKADKQVYQLFLQILEEGELTDSTGRKVNFKNTIVIATGNIGSYKKKCLGFSGTATKQSAEKGLEGQLPNELLARFDEVVEFAPLTETALVCIATKMLFELAIHLAEKGITIRVLPQTAQFIAKKGVGKFGARPMRKAIRNLVEDEICNFYLNGQIENGDTTVVGVENDKILIQIIKKVAVLAGC